MLDRIDLYGTLELSWTRCRSFLGELTQLVAAAVNDQEREVLEAVRRLSERCRTDHNLALRLVGD